MVTWFPTSVGSARIQQHAQGVGSTSRTLKGQQGTSGAPKNNPNLPGNPIPSFPAPVGAIGGEKNKKISAALAEVVQRQLGIPPSRFYIKASLLLGGKHLF